VTIARLAGVPTRETRLQRGRRRGEALVATSIGELRAQRIGLSISQRSLAAQLGCSQSEYSRLELIDNPAAISVVRLAEVAALLGLELALSLHPAGDPLRDKGHQALIDRFRAILAPRFHVLAEVPFPAPGDPRVWDLILRIEEFLLGVEAETRIRDLQALVRRIRQCERDGGVDEILLILSDSAVNRRHVGELRLALGERYATPPRSLLRALRQGERPIGSGVLLL
jgi:transcriptional regulator with XRE-family HTH domain